MFDTLGADQFIRKAFDLGRCATHYDNFQAVMDVEVDMQCGNDGVVVRVLMPGEFVGQIPGVMVVNQRHGTDRWRVIAAVYLRFHQGIANHIANRL